MHWFLSYERFCEFSLYISWLHTGKYLPPFIFTPFALIVNMWIKDWAKSILSLKLSLFKYNCVWANSRQGETLSVEGRKLHGAKITLFTIYIILLCIVAEDFVVIRITASFEFNFNTSTVFINVFATLNSHEELFVPTDVFTFKFLQHKNQRELCIKHCLISKID